MSVADEREDVQKKAFAKWINQRLVQGGYEPLKDLFLVSLTFWFYDIYSG